MSIAGILRRARSEGGFSMVEVTIATFLFVTSVLGLGSMLMSAGGLVNKSSLNQMASRLASEKIEAVKSLPFYNPSSSEAKVDIDDWYYNYIMGYANNQQFAHPTTYGTEATIANAPGFSRTTAVEFVHVTGSPPSQKLDPVAAMDANWINTNPTGTKFDRPKSSDSETLSAILIEVRVNYIDDGVARYVIQHGLASQFVTPGGSLNPLMVVQSLRVLSPPRTPDYAAYGYIGTEHAVQLEVTVNAPDLTANNVYEQVSVALWRPGNTDINGSPVTIVNSSTITCWVDLGGIPLPAVNWYNIAVYWGRKGLMENNLRNCFEVRSNPPTVTGVRDIENVDGVAWGYKKQSARKVRFYGTNFTGVANDTLKCWLGTNAEPEKILGNITSVQPDGTYMEADFNLTDKGGANESWNVKVQNICGSGSAYVRLNCFTMNPAPSISSIQATSDPSYYNWTYLAQTQRNVQINGSYLYGMSYPLDIDCQLRVQGAPTIYTDDAVLTTAEPYGNDCFRSVPVTMRFNPNTSVARGAGSGHYNTYWNVYIANYGGNVTSTLDSMRVLMNPVPVLGTPGGFPSPARTGTASNPSKTYTSLSLASCQYVQNTIQGIYLIKSASPPVTGTTPYVEMTGATINSAGTSLSTMSMRMHVNPVDNSFKIWGSGDATNPVIDGTYYFYFKNGDGQAAAIPGSTITISHAQYSYTISAKQPSWGTVSGGGTRYQDENVTITATPGASSNIFVAWEEPFGTDASYSNPWNLGVANGSRTIRVRFRKKLYYGPDTTPNWAGFIKGYCTEGYDEPTYTNVEGARYTMKIRSTAHLSFLSGHTGEVAVTANVSFTDASYMYIYWRQQDGNLNGVSNWAKACKSAGQNDQYNNGSWAGSDDVFGWRWDSVYVSGWVAGWVHVNSRTDYSVLGGNSTDIRVEYLYLE